MTDPTPWSHILRLSDLGGRRDSVFDLSPDAPTRQSLAADLDISGIKKLRFQGSLSPINQRDWQLTATIGATVVQPCVVTLALVSTRIDATITRQYLAEFEHPTTTGEIEMPEDDTAEPLPVSLD